MSDYDLRKTLAIEKCKRDCASACNDVAGRKFMTKKQKRQLYEELYAKRDRFIAELAKTNSEAG